MHRALVAALLSITLASSFAHAEEECDFGGVISAIRRFAERNSGGIASCDEYGQFNARQVNCADRQSPHYSLRQAARSSDDLNWLSEDILVQELAGNSVAQSDCRKRYMERAVNDSNTTRQLDGRARAAFNAVKGRMKQLIEYRAQLDRERSEWETVANGTGGRGGKSFRDMANVLKHQMEEVNDVIYRAAMTIPMGYETDVVNAIEKMAVRGRFDPGSYHAAIKGSAEKYGNAIKYFNEHSNVSGGRRYYCLDHSFRRSAGRSGALRRAVGTLSTATPEEKRYRDRLECRLDAQYESGPRNFNRGVLIASVLSAGVSGVANATGRAAILASTWLTAANVTIDAAYLAITTEGIRRDCFSNPYMMTSTRTCDPEKELQADIVDKNLSNCAINLTWAGWSAVTLPNHIRRYLRSRSAQPPQ